MFHTKSKIKMEATIKETVKNIFKTNKFEEALYLTRNLRGEYIKEFGVKSWNALVVYYRKLNIIPDVSVVAEPEKADDVKDDSNTTEKLEQENQEEPQENVDDTIEYMLYSNPGKEIEWFGHSENFRHYPIGHKAKMIRMNNRGVNEGVVVASAKMALDHVALFHRCYAVIIRMKRTNREQLELASRCLTNLYDAIGNEFHRVPNSDTKLTDYVLNFKK